MLKVLWFSYLLCTNQSVIGFVRFSYPLCPNRSAICLFGFHTCNVMSQSKGYRFLLVFIPVTPHPSMLQNSLFLQHWAQVIMSDDEDKKRFPAAEAAHRY